MDIDAIINDINADNKLILNYNNKNPFTPNFGAEPKAFLGRRDIIQGFMDTLKDGGGSKKASMSISGLRGSGKTVMLDCLGTVAAKLGYTIYSVDAYDGTVADLIEKIGLTRMQAKVAPSISVLGNSFSIGELNIEHSRPTRLTPLLEQQCQNAIKQHIKGIVILIDEIDIAYKQQLIEIAKAYKQCIKYKNVFIVMSGLMNQIEALKACPGTTFLFRTAPIILDSLLPSDAIETLINTCAGSGISIDNDAAHFIAQSSDGHPFAIQFFGAEAWDIAHNSSRQKITLEDAKQAVHRNVSTFVTQIIKPILKDLTTQEIDLVFAIALSGDYAMRRDLIKQLNWSDGKYSVYQRSLKRDRIVKSYRNQRGTMYLSVPFMKDYIVHDEERLKAVMQESNDMNHPLNSPLL